MSLDRNLRYNVTAGTSLAGRPYVWFRVAKVATRSILDLLSRETRVCVDDSWVRDDSPWLPSHAWTFAFVREPVARLLSCYRDKVEGREMFPECWGGSFDEFVEWLGSADVSRADRHVRPQALLLPPNVDFVGRFESLADDFGVVVEHLGLCSGLPHHNRSGGSRSDGSDFVSDFALEAIWYLYSEDYVRFNYPDPRSRTPGLD